MRVGRSSNRHAVLAAKDRTKAVRMLHCIVIHERPTDRCSMTFGNQRDNENITSSRDAMRNVGVRHEACCETAGGRTQDGMGGSCSN
ncbi:hypothetical protein FDECE_11673 [Fusarium decemcellulare]|nr:hypothetical protein FDECE_11673 [Fusarium decemcellulare]